MKNISELIKYFFLTGLLLYILFILISVNTAYSQNDKFSDIKMSAKYHYGLLLSEYPFFYYLVNDNIEAFEYNIQKEVSGKKLWHKVHKFPSIGISLFYSGLGNDSIFGKTFTINPYIQFKISKRKKFELKYQLGVGMCYVTHHFDFQENYHNIAVSSPFNIWFNAELSAYYHINPIISFTGGMAFSHISNANLSQPNFGLNNLTFFSGIQVNINQKEKNYNFEIPEFKRKNEYSVIIAGGTKHTRRFSKQLYFAGSVSSEYRRVLGHKFSLGAGSDFFYDASVPDELRREGKTDIKDIYKLKTGLHASQELIIGRFSIMIQEGIYLFLKDELDSKLIYNRGIIRYKFSDHFFVNIAAKSKIVVLDVIEIGVGYYWN
ncbi:MAG: acyloxyacyl hydrolase [Bacteroidales bacterium]|nr:acyloxyacyl hydrolase [Bacteroidales bacterium]